MSETFTVNGTPRAWQQQSLRALLEADGIALDRGGIAVALNAQVVPRAAWAETTIAPGDQVEIVGIVRGG